ncbi:hypothetical protein ACS15_2716 [Ralstonia insidiosa]|uniref:Uncharacterized protein n=1 Tax=Ralstonia insidiosa TaxID=190721 RepID=A0AAC9BCG3_9RALS|nr:hypothetical protein ACS15_2716 [Ralstonia insidiosa]
MRLSEASMLEDAKAGEAGQHRCCNVDLTGDRRWFDTPILRKCDNSCNHCDEAE